MSPAGVRLHRLAERELEEAFEYYEEQSPGLGGRFLTEATRAFLLILRHPRIAPVDRGEIRRFALATFPYSLFYETTDRGARILAVAHQKRRPGYWAGRR